MFVDHGIYEIQFQTTHENMDEVVSAFLNALVEYRKGLGKSKPLWAKWKKSYMLAESSRMQDPYEFTFRVLQDRFYSGIESGPSVSSYMDRIDKMLTHERFVDLVDKILKFEGARLFIASSRKNNTRKLEERVRAFLV